MKVRIGGRTGGLQGWLAVQVTMHHGSHVPEFREVRAVFDEETITVYQAFSSEIADKALRAGRFVPPFRRERMTWIKPSFLWMAYRSGYASKPGQERVLAVRMTRRGFEAALRSSCLSHFETDTYADRSQWEARRDATSVRVQWDPERDLRLQPMGYRSIQVGLAGAAAASYVEEWITDLTDATSTMHTIGRLIGRARFSEAELLLPPALTYPLPSDITRTIGATTVSPG